MRNFLVNMFFKYQRFMQGRYGFDELSRAMVLLALLIAVLSLFIPYVGYAGTVLIILAYVRAFSKNIYTRSRERDWWLKTTARLRSWVQLRSKMWKERKSYRYFKCKKCKSHWRVPKGVGKVEIKCRKCGHKMIKKA